MIAEPRIILLEDDPYQAEIIAEKIRKISPDCDLRYFDSEFSFNEAIQGGEIRKWNPQFAVIDLLVCYYSPEDLAAMEEDPDRGGPRSGASDLSD